MVWVWRSGHRDGGGPTPGLRLTDTGLCHCCAAHESPRVQPSSFLSALAHCWPQVYPATPSPALLHPLPPSWGIWKRQVKVRLASCHVSPHMILSHLTTRLCTVQVCLDGINCVHDENPARLQLQCFSLHDLALVLFHH